MFSMVWIIFPCKNWKFTWANTTSICVSFTFSYNIYTIFFHVSLVMSNMLCILIFYSFNSKHFVYFLWFFYCFHLIHHYFPSNVFFNFFIFSFSSTTVLNYSWLMSRLINSGDIRISIFNLLLVLILAICYLQELQ